MRRRPGSLARLRPLEARAQGARFLEIFVVQRLAGIGLDAPAGLVERPDLVSQQRLVVDDLVHTDTSSFTLRAASPRRCTFCSATTVGRYPSSQFEERYKSRGATVSARWRATSTRSLGDSRIELLPLITPATSPLFQPEPSALISV